MAPLDRGHAGGFAQGRELAASRETRALRFPAPGGRGIGGGGLGRRPSAAAGAGGIALVGDAHGNVSIVQPPDMPSGPEDKPLREAYLIRPFDQVSPLLLTDVDPKVANEAETRLRLAAVYTALLTETREREGEGTDAGARPGSQAALGPGAPEPREPARASR